MQRKRTIGRRLARAELVQHQLPWFCSSRGGGLFACARNVRDELRLGCSRHADFLAEHSLRG
jgi:hypothetical protein